MRDLPVSSLNAGYGDEDLLAISGIQHFIFCRRQWALIHVEGLWAENGDTVEGGQFHERTHDMGSSWSGNVQTVRSMGLVSRTWGLKGFADTVELTFSSKEDGPSSILPVEYKKGRSKAGPCDRMQLLAQAICLEEMLGMPVREGALFYGETRRRELVIFEDRDKERLEQVLAEMRRLLDLGQTPPPTKRGACKRCSLSDLCLPETSGRSASNYWGSSNGRGL